MADASIPIAPRGAPLPLQARTPTPLPERGIQGTPLPLGSHPTQDSQTAQARHAAEEFESVFLNEMLSPMFEGLSTDGLGGGGVGEEMFRPMLIDNYAKAITRSGGIGIADTIMRELTRMQTTPLPEDESNNGSGR